MMQQVSNLHPSGRHGAALPNMQEANKVKGGRQRLTKDGVPELVEASRQLDKVELVSRQQVERQMKDHLRELVLEEPHTANKSDPHTGGLGGGATTFGVLDGRKLEIRSPPHPPPPRSHGPMTDTWHYD